MKDAGLLLLKRIIAGTIDYGFFLLILVTWFNLFGDRIETTEIIKYEVRGWSNVFLTMTVLPIFWVGYFPGCEAVFGYTPGKGLLDLKVIKKNGQKVPFSAAFKRHLLDFVDVMIFIALLMMPLLAKKPLRRLGDLWADTCVIKVKKEFVKGH